MCRARRTRPRTVAALQRHGGALLLMWLLACPLSAAAGETRQVLVLLSSERPFAPQSSFVEALIPALIRASPEPLDFIQISVQDARTSGLAPDVSVAERIRAGFGTQELDLVVTVGGPAATFAQQFRTQLFPTTPTLFAGVDRRFVESATFADNETAVPVQHDPALVVETILNVLPETQHITVVIGASHVEQFWLKETQREFRRFDGRVQFAWTNELSFAEMVERCRHLPAHSAIFFAVLSLDAKGEPHAGANAFTALHDVANAPIFGLYERDLGRGLVGGPLLSADEMSRATAAVAVRLLAGELAKTVKTPTQLAGTPTFDGRELRRWNIPDYRLPPGSVIRFREATLWQQYQGPLIWVMGLVGPALVGILLLVSRARRRHARRRSVASQGPLMLPPNPTVNVWTATADGGRIVAGEAAGTSPGHSWTTSLHPDDVERSDEIYRRAFARREPFQMEYRVRDGNGVERWILDTGLPQFSGKAFDGYVGSTVDVTTLGRTRAELSDLSRHLLQAHERERAEMARKLHEDVCQRIMGLTLQLHGLHEAAGREDMQPAVRQIGEQLANLAGEIASLSDPVYRRIEFLGLPAVLLALCRELSSEHDVDIHFKHEDVPGGLPTDIALALFRVLQEAAVHALIHSGANEMWVVLRGTPAEVRLEIAASGADFPPKNGAGQAGVGLIAIRERLSLINGGSTIEPRPGGGTRVVAWVPLGPQRHAH